MADQDEPVDNGSEEEVVEQPAEEPAADPKEEIDEDAIAALAEGVKGELTENDDISQVEVEEPDPETPAGDEPEVVPASGDTVPDVEPEDEPAPELAPNPGDFQPDDYSFEVKTTDGKTVKISTPEDAEAFAARLDEEEGLITASQFLQFNRKAAAMDIGISSDKKAYDSQQEQYQAEQAVTDTRNETMAQWGRELEYLRQRDELPPLKPEYNTADWTNPEVAKDPGVKATTDILTWMDAENNRRIDSGLTPITSILDAHAAMQLETMKTQAKTADDSARSTRQRKGAMVGSGASTEEPLVRSGRDITGSGGTLDDLISEYSG